MSADPSPTPRRRRIFNAVIKPSNSHHSYSAVPSGKPKRKPSPFLDLRHSQEDYRVRVTRDGSMIAAVPVANGGLNKSGLRGSPILYSDANAVAPNRKHSKQSWGKQGLLEARGKQRSKLKNLDKSSGVGVSYKPVKSAIQRGKSGRQKVRWDLSQVKSEQVQQQKVNGNAVQKRDDESLSSFPILSSSNKFDDGKSSVKANNAKATGAQITNKATPNISNLKPPPPPPDDSPSNTTFTTLSTTNTTLSTNTTPSFQHLLQQRIHEIQSEKSSLLESMNKKEMIERTLISAIDVNLEKGRKRMEELNRELQEIQWHLSLKDTSHNREISENVARRTTSPDSSYGDPSLAMIDSTNDSITSGLKPKPSVTGLDPPARPSPITKPVLKRQPSGKRISAVMREEEGVFGCLNELNQGKQQMNQNGVHSRTAGPVRPVPKHSLQRNRLPQQQQQQQQNVQNRPQQQHTQNRPQQQQIQNRPQQQHIQNRPKNTQNTIPQQQQIQHPKPQRPPPRPPSKRITSSILNNGRRRMKKNVHFNLPEENESVELKFVNESPADAMMDGVNGYTDGNCNGQFFNSMPQSMNNSDTIPEFNDSQSWQGSLYDIETFDETTGNLISSEHYDTFQYHDGDARLVKTEHYSTGNHHHGYGNESQSAFKQYNRNLSTDTVDTEVAFIQAVAAVVIQTTVRRYLAEIRAMERLYAVQVIQSTICTWMARMEDTQSNRRSSRVVRKGVSFMPSPVRTHSPTKKRVMFQDDYNSHYITLDPATNIQRCFRGWYTREGIQIEHYAATQIQRSFRGWWAREALEVDRYCAIEIQRVIRGYLGRMSYIYDLYCVIVAQSIVRRYLAFYESAVRLANVLYLQAIFRGYRVRVELMRYVMRGQEVAATMIQAQYRSYDAQMDFINTLADILIVQSVARRWLTLRKMKQVKLQYSYHHGIRRQQQVAYNIHHNSSVSRVIHTLQHYPVSKYIQQNGQSPRVKSSRPPKWQQATKTEQHTQQNDHYADGFDTFRQIGVEAWYDGNKSEASEMLTNWKRRSSRSTNS